MTDVTPYLDGRTLILLSNREPYEHLAGEERIHVRQPPGGLVSALDPTMRRTGGTSRQRYDRELLRRAMEAEGFRVYDAEWWHFDYQDWRLYPIGNQTFDQIRPAP